MPYNYRVQGKAKVALRSAAHGTWLSVTKEGAPGQALGSEFGWEEGELQTAAMKVGFGLNAVHEMQNVMNDSYNCQKLCFGSSTQEYQGQPPACDDCLRWWAFFCHCEPRK